MHAWSLACTRLGLDVASNSLQGVVYILMVTRSGYMKYRLPAGGTLATAFLVLQLTDCKLFMNGP